MENEILKEKEKDYEKELEESKDRELKMHLKVE